MKLLYKLAKYKTMLSIVFVLALGLVISPVMTLAETTAVTTDTLGIGVIETGSDNKGGIALGTSDLRDTAVNIINIALSMLGIIAVVIILIGGFQWMTAGGDDGKVETARKWIFSGIIGLAIILSAWAIAKFALNNLGQATNVKDFTPVE
ncbi:MAG: pilin [Patescibacteria group bacterium]|nr:pilin [Patescibacteria group bacterium]